MNFDRPPRPNQKSQKKKMGIFQNAGFKFWGFTKFHVFRQKYNQNIYILDGILCGGESMYGWVKTIPPSTLKKPSRSVDRCLLMYFRRHCHKSVGFSGRRSSSCPVELSPQNHHKHFSVQWQQTSCVRGIRQVCITQ